MERIATHSGIVVAADHGTVTVRMRVQSACSSCEAHAHCGFAESKDKTVEVQTSDWRSYAPGDPVVVAVNTELGLRAVLLAYLLPAAVLLAVFVFLTCAGLSEVVVALLSLASVALYGFILYLSRTRLQRRFSFSLSRPE